MKFWFWFQRFCGHLLLPVSSYSIVNSCIFRLYLMSIKKKSLSNMDLPWIILLICFWFMDHSMLLVACYTGDLAFTRRPANIYMLKVNNRNTRKRCEICSDLTIKTPDNVSDVVLVFLLLNLNIFHTFFYCFYCWLWTSKR